MLPEVTEVVDAETAVACGNYDRVSIVRMLELFDLLTDARMEQWAMCAAMVADRVLEQP